MRPSVAAFMYGPCFIKAMLRRVAEKLKVDPQLLKIDQIGKTQEEIIKEDKEEPANPMAGMGMGM